MNDPIQPLKITLILLIVSEGFWLLSRLLSVVGLEIYSLLPSAVYNLIGMLSNVLMIVLFCAADPPDRPVAAEALRPSAGPVRSHAGTNPYEKQKSRPKAAFSIQRTAHSR